MCIDETPTNNNKVSGLPDSVFAQLETNIN